MKDDMIHWFEIITAFWMFSTRIILRISDNAAKKRAEELARKKAAAEAAARENFRQWAEADVYSHDVHLSLVR